MRVAYVDLKFEKLSLSEKQKEIEEILREIFSKL